MYRTASAGGGPKTREIIVKYKMPFVCVPSQR